MEASADANRSCDPFGRGAKALILQQMSASDPQPPAVVHTFHAGDRRFESGWGYSRNAFDRGVLLV